MGLRSATPEIDLFLRGFKNNIDEFLHFKQEMEVEPKKLQNWEKKLVKSVA